MPRLSIKGLLMKDVDDLYQKTVQSVFEQSGLPKEEFAKKLEERIDDVTDSFDKAIVREYARHYVMPLTFFHKSILQVEKAIARKFVRPFKYYFSYLSTCHHIMKHILETIHGMEQNQTDTVVIALFAQLLRRADQIGIMLLNGYTDSALVLWRSFYEFALALIVLAKQDDNGLSIRFMEHNIRHAKRLGESYTNRLVPDGFDELDEDKVRHIEEEYQKLSAKYGKDFMNDDLGWAEGLLGLGKKVTIRGMEDLAGTGRFRPYYIWASAYAHPNFEVFKHQSREDKIFVDEIKDVQPEKEDFVDPMQITIAVLQEVAESLLELISCEEELSINSNLLLAMYNKLIKALQ